MISTIPALNWTPQNGTTQYDENRGQLTLVADPGVDWSNDSLGGNIETDACLLGPGAPT